MRKMKLTKIRKKLEDLKRQGFPVRLTKKDYYSGNIAKVEGEITHIDDDGVKLINGLRKKHYVEMGSILHIEAL
jgi:hypothetical protein